MRYIALKSFRDGKDNNRWYRTNDEFLGSVTRAEELVKAGFLLPDGKAFTVDGEVIDLEAYTMKELRRALDHLGIEYNYSMRKSELIALFQ